MERRAVLQAIAGATMLASMGKPSYSAGGTPEHSAEPSTLCGAACGHRRADVHSHFLPAVYKRALKDAGLVKLDGGMPIPEWTVEGHLAAMSLRGTTTSILSISSPGLHFLAKTEARRVARQVNEAGAELSRTYAGQFGFFAVLPLPDIAACLEELAYAFDTLNADGVILESNFKGQYLGDPLFTPIWDELNRREAVLYLHPTSPQCFDQVGMGFSAPLIEFPFDTTRTAVDLIFNGVLKHRPSMKVILAHGGGALPIVLSRIAMVADAPFLKPRPQGGGAEVVEEVSKLYFDLALAASPLNFQALLQITNVSHLLFGTDYPFAPPPAIAANTSRYDQILAGLSDEHRRMIEYRNAAELFPRLRRYLQDG